MGLENVFRNKMQELNCYAEDLGFSYQKDFEGLRE